MERSQAPIMAVGSDCDSCPEPLRSLPIRTLHLKVRDYHALLRAGIETAGDVFKVHRSGLDGAGPSNALAAAKIHLEYLIETSSRGSHREIDWHGYWKQHNVQIIPTEPWSSVTASEVLQNLPALVQEVIQAEFKESAAGARAWTVVERRSGLGGSKTLRLDDLGKAYGLTRERVRQIEAKALKNLREALLEGIYAGRPYHVHLELLDALQAINHLILATAAPNAFGALIENELLDRVRASFMVEPDHLRPSLALLLTLAGFERHEFDNSELAPIWSRFKTPEWRTRKAIIRQIDGLLTRETGLPKSDLDVLVEVNRSRGRISKVTLPHLQALVDVCSTVERREDGLVWGNFHQLRRTNQVERLLFETAQPLDVATIVREINHRLSNFGQKIQHRTLQNQIIHDERFVPIGRSGRWKLKTWDHVHTGSIVELMEQCLATLNRPATIDEIYAYVYEHREDVSKNSIPIYLSSKPVFAQVDRTQWGLATWPETRAAQVWNTEQVANFVADVFREHRTHKLPYYVLRQQVMEAAKVTARQAQGLLRKNPAFDTRRGPREKDRFAIFQPDWKTRLAESKSRGRSQSATLKQRVSDSTYRHLESAPGKTLPYSELMTLLKQEFQRPTATLYSYVASLDFVERVNVPETRIKVCKLRVGRIDESFSKVRDIRDEDLRRSLERAVGFLTEENVDVGLFLLGKEFESTLKRFLSAAYTEGNISSGRDPAKMKLVDLVTCAKQNGMIEDEGALQYLRQQRNDRAHDPTPTLSERQIMLHNAPHFASLYIDYIKLLEDLYRTIG